MCASMCGCMFLYTLMCVCMSVRVYIWSTFQHPTQPRIVNFKECPHGKRKGPKGRKEEVGAGGVF